MYMLVMTQPVDHPNLNKCITSACTYACRFCQKENILDHSFSDLYTDEHLNEPIGSPGHVILTGGDPLLHPDLQAIIQKLTENGNRVSLVTNGSQLNQQNLLQLQGNVDWIWLPLDSCLDEKETFLGRGSGNHVSHIIHLAAKIHELGIHLGLWTVVCQETYQENLLPLLRIIEPERWKVVPEPGLSADKFRHFINRHSQIVLDCGRSPDFSYRDNAECLCGYTNTYLL